MSEMVSPALKEEEEEEQYIKEKVEDGNEEDSIGFNKEEDDGNATEVLFKMESNPFDLAGKTIRPDV